jgi:hypothetical protein
MKVIALKGSHQPMAVLSPEGKGSAYMVDSVDTASEEEGEKVVTTYNAMQIYGHDVRLKDVLGRVRHPIESAWYLGLPLMREKVQGMDKMVRRILIEVGDDDA